MNLFAVVGKATVAKGAERDKCSFPRDGAKAARHVPVPEDDSVSALPKTAYDSLAQLVEQRPFKAKVRGSSPRRVTTSEQSSLCSDVLFYKRTSSARYLAPPFQIEPAALGFDLVKMGDIERAGFCIFGYGSFWVPAAADGLHPKGDFNARGK